MWIFYAVFHTIWKKKFGNGFESVWKYVIEIYVKVLFYVSMKNVWILENDTVATPTHAHHDLVVMWPVFSNFASANSFVRQQWPSLARTVLKETIQRLREHTAVPSWIRYTSPCVTGPVSAHPAVSSLDNVRARIKFRWIARLGSKT